MINQTQLCFGQKIDPKTWHLFPWFTHGALDVLDGMDLSDKNILEWGSGSSTVWFAAKAKSVVSIEANSEWYGKVVQELNQHNLFHKVNLILRQTNEGDQSKIDYYTEVPEGFKPDIVVVDGILRYECILKALTLPRPLTLIVDNWMQSYVFMCPAAEEALKGFKSLIFEQADHVDNDGVNKWKTAIFEIL